MNPLRHLFFAAAMSCAATPSTAQDLIGVTWPGTVVRIDSHTGAAAPFATGLSSLNCLARSANGSYWSVQRVTSTYHLLVTIDPNTGAGSTFSSCVDVRGLAEGPGDTLFGIQYTPNGSVLVSIDTLTGYVATIGSTGFYGIQGLAMHQGTLYGWEVIDGLVTIDQQTGVATDPFPGVPVPTYLQSLCSHPDGRLLVGGGDSNGPDSLYVVDLNSGAANLLGQMGSTNLDVRGIEPLGAYIAPFGQGCSGEYGQVALAVTGSPQTSSALTTTSTNHSANAVGLAVFGVDSLSFLGVQLPASLDALFGTSNCTLYTGIDGSFAMLSGAVGPAQLQFGFTVPASASGALLHLQHACLENVPGGISWSNGVAIRIQ